MSEKVASYSLIVLAVRAAGEASPRTAIKDYQSVVCGACEIETYAVIWLVTASTITPTPASEQVETMFANSASVPRLLVKVYETG